MLVKPEMPPAPPLLSNRMPPKDPADAAVIVRVAVPLKVPPPSILRELAAKEDAAAKLPDESQFLVALPVSAGAESKTAPPGA